MDAPIIAASSLSTMRLGLVGDGGGTMWMKVFRKGCSRLLELADRLGLGLKGEDSTLFARSNVRGSLRGAFI